MKAERATGSSARVNAVVQIALGMSNDRSNATRPYRDIQMSLGEVRDGGYYPALTFTTGTPDLAPAVARGEIDLAAMNPSGFLSMAYRGTGLYSQPLPLRAIAVLPSWDRMAFAVSGSLGLASFEELRERKVPLRLSMRGNKAHATRFIVDEILSAYGLSLGDLESWGSQFSYHDMPSHPDRLAGIRDGTIDAVFDEGVKGWGNFALQHRMRFLPLGAAGARRMDELGWPTGPIPRDRFPLLTEDVTAASFSGWPLYTHATLNDDVAYGMVGALEKAQHAIDWDLDRPVELRDLCRDSDAAPLDLPLHPGAMRYYVERGAL